MRKTLQFIKVFLSVFGVVQLIWLLYLNVEMKKKQTNRKETATATNQCTRSCAFFKIYYLRETL